MRVLLAEDEKRMAAALVAILKQEKYDTDHFADGESALIALKSNVYDISVLDVMMPGMNGFDVARKARKDGIGTPILMLTAKSQVDDKVAGLDSGADDYLTKPFDTKELLARLRALIRRKDGIDVQDGNLYFGDLSLNPACATLTCETTGQSIRLGEKELRILEYMFANRNRIMTREQLALKIWGFESGAEYNNVEVYMSFTRKKLAFVGSKVEIKAVRGIGYEMREKMFDRTRREIIVAIMMSLVFLFAITLSVILYASSREVRRSNSEKLERYVDLFFLEQSEPGNVQDPALRSRTINPPPEDRPDYRLSTFYAVALSTDGQVLKTDNSGKDIYSEEELAGLARQILKSGKESGVTGNLLYRVSHRPGYSLVAFLDITVTESNFGMLLRNVIIVGSSAIVVLFLLSLFIAGRIVRPLEENDRRQRQFISDASHELKTPIAVVGANAEILSRQTGKNEWLDNIIYENIRMGTLVKQLLDLSGAESSDAQKKQLDLSRIVSGEVLALESLAYDRGKTIQSKIEDGIHIIGNAAQLQQVVSILIDNAIQHSTGTVIGLFLSRQSHSALLRVENDGYNIPQEKLKHLFDRFFRLDEARNSEGSHYGLGLSIAKAVVEKHRGSIDVSCQNGRIRFTVSLPL